MPAHVQVRRLARYDRDVHAIPWPDRALGSLLLRERTGAGRTDGAHTGADLLKATRRSSYVACITVSRTSADDVGFREVFVSVDQEQVAVLRYGDSITCEVPAGPHQVRAHNTLFWKSRDIVLQPGEHARFIAVNRAGWGTFGLLLLLGVAPIYLTFDRSPDPLPGPERDAGEDRTARRP